MAGGKPRIRVGRPDVSPSAPAHTPGNNMGNAPGNYEKQSGHRPDGTSTARRSTGIRAADRDPVDPSMPSLSPP